MRRFTDALAYVLADLRPLLQETLLLRRSSEVSKDVMKPMTGLRTTGISCTLRSNKAWLPRREDRPATAVAILQRLVRHQTHPEFPTARLNHIWRLRQEDGCPGDKEQTHQSISKNMIEEGYEAVEAIAEGSPGAS